MIGSPLSCQFFGLFFNTFHTLLGTAQLPWRHILQANPPYTPKGYSPGQLRKHTATSEIIEHHSSQTRNLHKTPSTNLPTKKIPVVFNNNCFLGSFPTTPRANHVPSSKNPSFLAQGSVAQRFKFTKLCSVAGRWSKVNPEPGEVGVQSTPATFK